MDKYFLDSSIIVEYLRDNKEIVNFIDSFPNSLVSGYVVKAELYEGVYSSNNYSRDKIKLEQFFSGLDKIYGITNHSSNLFGKIRAELRKSGLLIDDFDILIASICIASNLPLITLNVKHFKRIKGLNILLPQDLD